MRQRRLTCWVNIDLVRLKTTSFQPMKISFSFQSTCSERLHTLSTLRDHCRTLIPKNLPALRNMVYGERSPSPSSPCASRMDYSSPPPAVAFEPPHEVLRLSRPGSRGVESCPVLSPCPSHGLSARSTVVPCLPAFSVRVKVATSLLPHPFPVSVCSHEAPYHSKT